MDIVISEILHLGLGFRVWVKRFHILLNKKLLGLGSLWEKSDTHASVICPAWVYMAAPAVPDQHAQSTLK
jgi:hypothetical protein